MKPSKIASTLIVAASCFLAAATGRSQSIDTFPSWDGSNSFADWGSGGLGTNVYGETFTPTAGQIIPRTITFAMEAYNGAAHPIPFQAFVYQWTGTGVTGPALFQSAVSVAPVSNGVFGNIKVTLANTLHGHLTPGQQYVVFYSTQGQPNYGGNSAWGATGGNPYPGGTGVFSNTQSGDTLTTFGANNIGQDFAFLMTFGVPAFAPYALTPNQHAVASALDRSVASNNAGIQDLVNSLYDLNLNDLPQAFDMISGEELTSVYNTAYNVAHLQNSAITQHLMIYVQPHLIVNTDYIALDMASGGKSTADGKGSKEIVQPVSDNRWGFFATANGDYTDITGDPNANGFQYATEGLTIGVDYKLTPNLVLGGYLAYEHSFTNLTNNGAIDANGITGGLYGSWFSHGFYVDGIVGGGYSGFTERRLSAGGNTRGDGDNTILNAALNGGYDMHSGPWTFGPQVGLEYDDVWLSSFTENGSLAPLSVAAQSENSLRSTAGGHLSYTTHVGGVTVRPDVHAAWQHEYDSPSNSLGAGIAGTNAAFVVQGPNLGRDSALAGVGVTVDLSEKTSVYVNYEGQFGRKNTTQSDVNAGFSTKF